MAAPPRHEKGPLPGQRGTRWAIRRRTIYRRWRPRRGDYDALEAIATRLRGNGKDIQRFPWDCEQSKYQKMINLLATGTSLSQTEHDKRMKEWLAAHPNSVTARLVQAKRLIRLGWRARGSGFADTVSEEGWRVFRKHIEDAHKIIMPIADADDPPPEVFPLLFEVAKTQSF